MRSQEKLRQAQIPPVASRHDMTRHDKHDVVTWRDETCRAVSCVLRIACSNRADDEEAACKTISCFIIIYYFSSRNEIKSFIETNYGDHNFIHITNKLSCVSRLSRSWWRTCRACCARRDVLWRAVSRLLYSVRDTACTTFSYTKMHGPDSESWRVVTRRNKWNLGLSRYGTPAHESPFQYNSDIKSKKRLKFDKFVRKRVKYKNGNHKIISKQWKI